MPVFISPDGNREVWEEKPYGYYTEEEWWEENPEEKPEPPHIKTEEEIWKERCGAVNFEIKGKLQDTDYAMLPDAPFTEEEKEEIRAYRAQLRDMNHWEGYPWDGGPTYDLVDGHTVASETIVPWPELPDCLKQ